MKSINRFHLLVVTQLALIPVLVISAAAQAGRRRSAEDTRRAIANDTFRELMKNERETAVTTPAPKSDAERAATLKQIREDFRAIQDVNNKMMSQAWAQDSVDYHRTSTMLGEINDKATRLKGNLALPQPEKIQHKRLTVTGQKELKSALLLMDRSLMNFVNNPIFRERNVVEVNLAAQATQDLEDVIAYSANLKRIVAHLVKSAANH